MVENTKSNSTPEIIVRTKDGNNGSNGFFKGHFKTDINGKLIYADHNLAKMFGYESTEELINNVGNVKDTFYQYPDHRLCFIQATLKKNETFHFETTFKRKDNTLFMGSIRYKVDINENNSVSYSGVIEDITNCPNLSCLYRNSKSGLFELFENQKEGVYVLKFDTPIDTELPVDKIIEEYYEKAFVFDCNNAFAKNYGYQSKKALLNKRLSFLHDSKHNHENRNILKEFITKNFKIENAITFEYDSNGKSCTMENNCFGTIVKKKLISVIGSQINVTDEYLSNLRLEGVLNELNANKNFNKILLNNISHEIRTPMNAIIGFSSLLIKDFLANEKNAFYLKLIHDNSLALLHIVDSLVVMSKVQSKSFESKCQLVNIHTLLKTVKEKYENDAEKKGIKIEIITSFRKNDFFAYINENKILKILDVLVNNAVKFTQNGFVKICSISKGQKLEFKVIDSGCGIDENNNEIIFDAFVKIAPCNKKFFPGMGLGLSIAKSLASELNTEIKLISTVNKGSEFSFSIKLNVI